jgi:hypothetical protein
MSDDGREAIWTVACSDELVSCFGDERAVMKVCVGSQNDYSVD